MNKKIFLILTTVVFFLCSCENNSTKQETNIYTENISSSVISSNILTDNFDFEKFKYENISNLNSYEENFIFTCVKNNKQSTSYISTYNTSNEITQNTSIDANELKQYDSNKVELVKQFDGLFVYSGSSLIYDEFQKSLTNNFIGFYNSETKENIIKVVDNEYINNIMYDKQTDHIIYQTDECFYILDMSLNLITTVNFYDIISEKLSECYNYEISTVIDNNGCVYLNIISPEKKSVFKFNRNFDVEWELTENDLLEFGNCIQIGTLIDGSIVLYYYDSDYWYVNVIDNETGKTEERYEIDNNGDILFGASSDADYIILSDGYFELFDLKSGQRLSTVIFQDCDWDSWKSYVYNSGEIISIELPNYYSSTEAIILDCNGEVKSEYEIIGKQISGNYIYDGNGGFYSVYNNRIIHNNINENKYLDINVPETFELCAVADNFLFKRNDDFFLYSIDNELLSQFILESRKIVAFVCEEGEEKLYYIDDKNELMIYDINSEKIQSIDAVNSITTSDYNAYYDGYIHDIYIVTNNEIYSYDIDNKICCKLINDISGLSYSDGCEIRIFNKNGCMAYSDYEFVYVLTPSDDKSDKNIINIAYIGEVSNVIPFDIIQKYNETNSDYFIKLKKYEDTEILNYDVSSDNIPDILISGSDISLKKYADKNMFMDLSSYIENDTLFKRDEFFENLLEMYSNDDGVYSIFPSFTISSYSIIGQSIFDAADFQSLKLFCDKISVNDNCYFIDSEGAEDVLSDYLPVYISDFKNKDIVDFDTEQFRSYVSILRNKLIDIDYDGDDFKDLINNDCCMVKKIIIQSGNSLKKYMSDVDNKLSITGYPGENGPYVIVLPDISYSISESSRNKAESWEIIHELFESGINSESLSVNKNLFDYSFENFQDESLEKEFYVKIKTMLENSNSLFSCDKNIENIVVEELQEYLYDNKDLDVVIDTINNKANIYMNEVK